MALVTTPPYFPEGGKKDPPKPSASKDKVPGVTPSKPRVPIETGVPDVVFDDDGNEIETVGPPAPEDDSITAGGVFSSEAIDAQINDIAAMQNPCDAVGEFFEELADKIDELKEKFDQLIDLFVDKVSNFLGVPAVIVRWVVDYALIKAGLQKEFQSENIFKEVAGLIGVGAPGGEGEGGGSGAGGPDGGGPSFQDELRRLYQLGLDSQQFLEEVERMKRKWGGFDPSLDEILDDPSGWIRSLGADFERLCNMIPKYEAAKKGGLKVTTPAFGLGFPIPLIEILEEGPSPWITKLLDVLEELDFSGLEAHQHYDKITDEADGYCSWGDV